MSYTTSAFAEFGYSEFLAPDGRAVRLSVEVQDYVGTVRDLGPVPAPGGCVLQWQAANAAQRTEPLAPVLLSTATIGAFTGSAVLPFWADGLHTLRSLNPGAVRLRVLTNDSGTFAADSRAAGWDLAWCGFMLQEGGTVSPGRFAPTGLVFRDGLHLLADRPWLDAAPTWDPADGSGDEERLVDALIRILSELEGDGYGPATLETVIQRWPYVPSDAPGSTVDPMAALRVMHAALWNPETGDTADQATAVRQVVARVLGRVCQARGGWSVVGAATLADTGGASVPLHTYDLSAHTPETTLATTGSGTRTTPDMVQEVFDTSGDAGDGYRLIDSVEDSTGAPVVECLSVYDFEADLENLIFNGSFEIEGASTSDALFWTQEESAARGDLSGYDAEFTNRFNMGLGGRDLPDARTAIEQDGLSFFVGLPTTKIHFAFSAYGANDPEYPADDARWRVGIGGYGIRKGTARVVIDSLRGRGVSLFVKPLLLGTGLTDSDAVDGVTILPPGTALTFDLGAGDTALFTLTEAAKVGDTQIVGDLDTAIDVSGGDVDADFYYFGPDATPEWHLVGLPDADLSEAREVSATMYAVGCDGVTVSGYTHVRAEGPQDDDSSYDPGADPPDPVPIGSGLGVDDFLLRPGEEGRGIRGYARRARLTPGRTGYPIALPASGSEDHLLGDGPLPTSRTRLRVEGASGDIVDTSQGEDTAWRNTAWSTDTPDDDDADSIDAFLARDALRLLGAHAGQGGEGRLSFDVMMQPTTGGDAPEALWPDRPMRLGIEGRVQLYASTGATTLVMSHAPTPGQFVVIRRAPHQTTGSEETVTADADPATVLIGSMSVPLASGTAGAIYPDARAFCGILALPVSMAWDLTTARVTGSALKLAPASETFIEEITLSD